MKAPYDNTTDLTSFVKVAQDASRKLMITVIIATVVPGVVIITAVIGCCYWCKVRSTYRASRPPVATGARGEASRTNGMTL